MSLPPEWPLSPVYPPHIKPARDGVYLTRPDDKWGWMTMIWSHSKWSFVGENCDARLYEWCGLVFDPAAAEREHDADTGGMGWFVPDPGKNA